jgi:hypothetical protein
MRGSRVWSPPLVAPVFIILVIFGSAVLLLLALDALLRRG